MGNRKRLDVRFRNIRDIRMGSPYNLCDIVFEGEWKPALPKEDWQDLKAISPDNRYIALVQWNTADNQPGFHIVRIDASAKKYHKTKRIMGLCKEIYWDNGRFKWEKDSLA